MEDNEEVDILGDFDYKSSGVLSPSDDDSELPSNSVQLLPEFSQHPWVLEQGWSLDNCTDLKSRVALEKMLQEEQWHMEGRLPKSERSLNLEPNTTSNTGSANIPAKRKSLWSEEEKGLFYQGLQIYGRRWSKISELIPSKTHQQVKNFALHHLKKKLVTKEATNSPYDNVSLEAKTPTLDDSLRAVKTGSPTVPVLPTDGKHKIRRPSKNNNRTASATNKTLTAPVSSVTSGAEIIRITSSKMSESEDEDIDIEIESDGDELVFRPSLPETTEKTVGEKSNKVTLENDQDTATVSLSENSLSNSIKSAIFHNDTLDFDTLKFLNTQEKLLSPTDGPCDADVTIKNKESLLHESHCEFIKGGTYSKDDGGGIKINPGDPMTEQTLDIKPSSLSSAPSDEEDEHLNEYALVNSDGDIIYLPNPTAAVTLDRQEISSQERHIHVDFFDGRPGTKTEDRYLRIRNHILDSWDKSKPAYLKKTSARSSLKNCGDVNCVGRIHSYLEQIGAINFGCEQAQYKQPYQRPLPRPSQARDVEEHKGAVVLARMESMRPRKRRVKDAFGDWIDEKDLEGKTIQHEQSTSQTKKADEVCKRKPRVAIVTSQNVDPFKLVPCSSFTTEQPAPFTVKISNLVLATMDVHAHLSKTEVIGLLGGIYLREDDTLDISLAEPCDSLSTGMQCEMNPVSQTEACERIHTAGRQVVGWYHSHPVFEANPSVRDMETQLEFQEWFSKGGDPFVGIIVSPYTKGRPSLCSHVQCLIVKAAQDSKTVGTPFMFEYVSYSDEEEAEQLETKLDALIRTYAEYNNRVELLQPFKSLHNMSAMDKMLRSLHHYLTLPHQHDTHSDVQPSTAALQQHIRELVESFYRRTSKIQTVQDSANHQESCVEV